MDIVSRQFSWWGDWTLAHIRWIRAVLVDFSISSPLFDAQTGKQSYNCKQKDRATCSTTCNGTNVWF
jgi:hypothetical protein